MKQGKTNSEIAHITGISERWAEHWQKEKRWPLCGKVSRKKGASVSPIPKKRNPM